MTVSIRDWRKRRLVNADIILIYLEDLLGLFIGSPERFFEGLLGSFTGDFTGDITANCSSKNLSICFGAYTRSSSSSRIALYQKL